MSLLHIAVSFPGRNSRVIDLTVKSDIECPEVAELWISLKKKPFQNEHGRTANLWPNNVTGTIPMIETFLYFFKNSSLNPYPRKNKNCSILLFFSIVFGD